jgi:hypothetical protein
LNSKRVILFFCLLFTSVTAFSQSKSRNRYEWSAAVGPTNFLGELGGADRTGTHFIRDFDLNSSRYCASAALRYKNGPWFSYKGALTFAMLSGKDAYTFEKYRNNRNLSFRSPIVEISGQVEFYFIREKSGSMYKISGLTGKKKKRHVTAYIFAGLGAFYFSPHAKYNDHWYSLRKLHTEGQGLPGGPKQYSNFNFCIPLGIGVRKMYNKKWSFGAELSFMKTFTDYIDDVSGNYYDKAKLAAAYGPVSAALSDPSKGDVAGQTATGQQRGDPRFKDAYMFLTFNVGYKFPRKGRTRAKF